MHKYCNHITIQPLHAIRFKQLKQHKLKMWSTTTAKSGVEVTRAVSSAHGL